MLTPCSLQYCLTVTLFCFYFEIVSISLFSLFSIFSIVYGFINFLGRDLWFRIHCTFHNKNDFNKMTLIPHLLQEKKSKLKKITSSFRCQKSEMSDNRWFRINVKYLIVNVVNYYKPVTLIMKSHAWNKTKSKSSFLLQKSEIRKYVQGRANIISVSIKLHADSNLVSLCLPGSNSFWFAVLICGEKTQHESDKHTLYGGVWIRCTMWC